MPGHNNFTQFSTGPIPLWSFVENLANDIDNHPFFAGGPSNNRRGGFHGRGGRHHGRRDVPTDNDGISVSPRYTRSWFNTTSDGENEDTLVAPVVDVYDTPDSYIVIANVPGANASNIDVDFDTTENELVINGVLNSSISDEHRQKYLKIGERKVGKFERKVKFPSEPKVDDENIKAKYSNGVLKLILPKITPVQPEKRRIPVSLDEDEDVEVEEVEETKDDASTTTAGEEEDSILVETPQNEKSE